MKIGRSALLLVVCLFLFPQGLMAAAAGVPFADLVLFNGKIVTVDKNFHIAQAIAVRDGKILLVGKNREILDLAGPKTIRKDLGGKTLIPGLIDSHNHMDMAEEGRHAVPLHQAKTVGEALALIREAAAKTKPGDWIRGGAWHPLAQLQEKRYLTRKEIDSVAPNHPVYLITVGHAIMCNSNALRLAGITQDTPNPPGGEIHKDPAGEPDGVLLEAAARLVSRIVPLRPFASRVAIFKEAMSRLNAVGLTGVVIGVADPASTQIYQHIWSRREATLRVSLMYAPTGEYIPDENEEQWEQIIKRMGFYSGFGDDWLNFAGIKLMIDGGMTLKTAYTRNPYPHDPAYRGSRLMTPEKLNNLVAICNRYNWRVGVHCVGDAAVDLVLDAYEYADKEKSLADQRFSLIHASLMQPDQMERAKKLGVRIEVQNVFMWDKAAAVERFLGKGLADRACPTRWMIDRLGINSVGAGTDSPVNTFNPFINMYVMVTRKDKHGGIFGADQKISREEALRLYTSGSAASFFKENLLGSLEPGKLADMVLLSEDLLTCPEETIKDIKVEMTVLEGKIVFEGKK